MIEIVTFLQLLWLGVSNRNSINKADVIIFHIAYPSLVFWGLLKHFYKKKVIISEHWSAYHFNFGVKKTLPRVQRIFHHGIPVIAVSNALGNDIRRFAKASFPLYVIPNIVSGAFVTDTSKNREPFFFMVSQWKSPKDPFPLFKAFLRFNYQAGHRYELLVAGYGPLYDDMLAWKELHDDSNSIRFLGLMNEQQIAEKMQTCSAFLHPTHYETFSVVCAEALSCGALVVAPRVGGIPEVVGNSGILLDSWNEADWLKALQQTAGRAQVTHQTKSFSADAVGKSYFEVINEIVCGRVEVLSDNMKALE